MRGVRNALDGLRTRWAYDAGFRLDVGIIVVPLAIVAFLLAWAWGLGGLSPECRADFRLSAEAPASAQHQAARACAASESG